MANVRHALFWMTLRENLRGIIITSLVVGACALAVGTLIARRASPIVNVERLTGTVVNAVNATPDPEGAVGSGFSYLYGVRLDETNLMVFAYGHATAPRVIGSKISIERQNSRNGTQTYSLLRQ